MYCHLKLSLNYSILLTITIFKVDIMSSFPEKRFPGSTLNLIFYVILDKILNFLNFIYSFNEILSGARPYAIQKKINSRLKPREDAHGIK